MDGKLRTLLIGVIITILIVNTSVILSFTLGIVWNSEESQQQIVSAPTTSVTPTQTISQKSYVTLEEESTEPKIEQTPIPTPTKPYVYIEAAPTTTAPKHHDLHQEFAINYLSANFTIYSFNNQKMTQNMPRVSFNLKNPPLVIKYEITPMNITDVKYLEYKILSKDYKVNQAVVRPYEDAWFKIIIRDRKTGEIVAEDGSGKTYSLQSPKQLVLHQSGSYRFEFYGDFCSVDLTMNVKKEGNID